MHVLCMYCTAPLSPRKGRLISFHDDDDDDDDFISRTYRTYVARKYVLCCCFGSFYVTIRYAEAINNA